MYIKRVCLDINFYEYIYRYYFYSNYFCLIPFVVVVVDDVAVAIVVVIILLSLLLLYLNMMVTMGAVLTYCSYHCYCCSARFMQ